MADKQLPAPPPPPPPPPPAATAGDDQLGWREAFPDVPTDELDAPGMWSDPNFSLSKSANIGEERMKEKYWSCVVLRSVAKPSAARKRAKGKGKKRKSG